MGCSIHLIKTQDWRKLSSKKVLPKERFIGKSTTNRFYSRVHKFVPDDISTKLFNSGKKIHNVVG